MNPRQNWTKAGAIVLSVVLLVMLILGLRSRQMSHPYLADYGDLQEFIHGARLSAKYSDKADFHTIVDFLVTLTPEQANTMRECKGLAFSRLHPRQQGILAALAERYPDCFRDADLRQSIVLMYVSPSKTQFEWYFEQRERDNGWAMGMQY